MALASGSVFNVSASATSGNLNGAGFNPANANFPTDGVIAGGTGSTPTLTSATYSFVAGDVGAAIYLPAQANITSGFYPITSVSAGVATINAAIGAAWQLNTASNFYAPNTVAGCATTAAPTGIKYGVNYAMQNTAIINGVTDFAAVGASTTLTSVTANFTPVMVGNYFHQTTTGTGAFGIVGWYEIVSYTNATTVVLDRTENGGTASAACTGYVGGAGRLNGLEDTFQAMIPANTAGGLFTFVWVQSGTYTISQNVSSTGNINWWVGYTTVPGDTCNNASRPVLAFGAFTAQFAALPYFRNIIGTGTSANGVQVFKSINCQFLNSSVTFGRFACSVSNANPIHFGSEFVSQNGTGLSGTIVLNANLFGCYIHDCSTGVTNSPNAPISAIGNIFESNVIAAITNTSSGTGQYIANNTFYGREAKMGIGINGTSSTQSSARFINNIFYGLATGILETTAISNGNQSIGNNFFNNTTDATFWNKDASDLALNPNFTNVSQVTGTTGQGLAGSKLQDTTQNFTTAGVVANRDYLHITSGGTLTAGCYLITAITTTTNPNDTLTLNNSLGTGAATGVYWITVGHNFQIGTNLKANGFPSFTNATGGLTTSFMDVGAVQRQEASGGGTVGYAFVG